ncbi:MAG: hypothetical protein AAFZ92_09660 [Pseudomonadota bacterium]
MLTFSLNKLKMTNPLLEEHPLPPFAAINIEHIKPAIESRIQQVWDTLPKRK